MKGDLLWHWFEHVVRLWTNGYVRKQPTWHSSHHYGDIQDSIKLFGEFLGDFLPQTKVFSNNEVGYVIIQRKVEGSVLAKLEKTDISDITLLQIVYIIDKFLR